MVCVDLSCIFCSICLLLDELCRGILFLSLADMRFFTILCVAESILYFCPWQTAIFLLLDESCYRLFFVSCADGT